MEQRYLTFVALGDSLTAGFQSPTRINPYGMPSPYTAHLLDAAWKHVREVGIENLTVSIENEGVNGDRTRGMLGRFETRVKPHKPEWVIIWAGLNDLSSGASVDATVDNMEKLIQKTREIKAEPIVLTLSPTAGPDKFNAVIRDYNDKLIGLCRRTRTACVDLHPILADENGSLAPKYSNDGAHLNTAGYMRVSEAIFETKMREIINNYR